MFLLVSHYPDFLITSCIHAFENYVQSIVLYGLRPWVNEFVRMLQVKDLIVFTLERSCYSTVNTVCNLLPDLQ